jgi:hypothetical protein
MHGSFVGGLRFAQDSLSQDDRLINAKTQGPSAALAALRFGRDDRVGAGVGILWGLKPNSLLIMDGAAEAVP